MVSDQSQMQSKGPKLLGQQRISVLGMKKHNTGLVRKITDTTFKKPIVVMGIDTQKIDSLIGQVDGGQEVLGSKNANVPMVVTNLDIMLSSKPFEGLLGQDGLFSQGRLLFKYEVQAESMVNKKRCHIMTLGSGTAHRLDNQAWGHCHHLIIRNGVSRVFGSLQNLVGPMLATPWMATDFAKEASSTWWRFAFGKMGRRGFLMHGL